MMSAVARPASYVLAYDHPPISGRAGARSWVVRGANFAVAYSEVRAGEQLLRADDVDEHMLLVPPAMTARIDAGTESVLVEGGALAIVPPGPSTVTAECEGYLVRIFSSSAQDIMAEAGNADSYADGAEEVSPLGDGALPQGGYRLRIYRFEDMEAQTAGAPFMLLRSQHLMANIFKPFVRPRDTTRLSPHHHDDFEQCSLALTGEWVHQLRYPWSPNLADWRADEAIAMGSPSMLIIPAKVIHTTYVTSQDGGWLIDIFAPARADFLAKPGLVLNAGDYPERHSADAPGVN